MNAEQRAGRAILAASPALLARWGFAELRRVAALLDSPEFAGLVDIQDRNGLLRALGDTADPDQAVLSLVRLLESARTRGPDVDRGLREALARPGSPRERLAAVIGGSAALSDHLVTHPHQWVSAASGPVLSADERRAAILAAVAPGSRGERSAYDALRVAYRDQLLTITAADLTAPDPLEAMPGTASALADLAAAALEGALAIAIEEHPEAAAVTRLAVIGMGKCGGGELNYVSDVDVIFVAEPVAEPAAGGAGAAGGARDAASEDAAIAAATQLATTLMRACSANTAEGTLWPVDAALRPEGKRGPLVRTVASHRTYYDRWAKTWEFQALLKARVVAGDREVGQAYLDAMSPMVWQASQRDRFVEDVQAMRRRVEEHVPAAEAKRQLKLGPGGLRDVEFSVQLLQMVHGRADERLRSRTTLEALGALAAGGYIGREDARALDESYRLLRCLEHRVQLYRMRRTHLMPTAEADLRRLGRAMGYRRAPAAEVVEELAGHAREVRRLHERVFYRPLLAAAARLSTDEARLTPEAARARLAALGFADPGGAMRHLEALTSGYSRTAAMQRTLLPVMLGWFAQEADPDAGLLTFRRVSDSLGSTHWYLKMLRDEGQAAERMARVLARSRYAGELLERAPDAAAILGADEQIQPRGKAAVWSTMHSAMRRRESAEHGLQAARAIRRTELFRIAVADLSGTVGLEEVGAALTNLTEALLESALELATQKLAGERGDVPAALSVIGMGRLGGRECGYGSDADVIFVYDPHKDLRGANEQEAGAAALAVVQEVIRLLGQASPDPQLEIDLDLRPEGRSGPMIRSLAGYRAYYERWSSRGWEPQALLRARPVAGDPALGDALMQVLDPVRYPEGGPPASALKEIRRLKARMESERLPRGADPRTHLKLGPGALSDVEWTVQLLQLQHAFEVPDLRTTSTLDALRVATEAGLLRPDDAETLRAAWCLASRLRNAIVLWRGRASDSLPKGLRDAEGVYRIVGGPPGAGAELDETYRRAARRARHVTQRVFYGEPDVEVRR